MPILESSTVVGIGAKIFADLLANKDALNAAIADYLANLPAGVLVNYKLLSYDDPAGPGLIVAVNWEG